jgi:hypothetical protein
MAELVEEETRASYPLRQLEVAARQVAARGHWVTRKRIGLGGTRHGLLPLSGPGTGIASDSEGSESESPLAVSPGRLAAID